MHKAGHPVCKDMAGNAVSIEAAPETNTLSRHPIPCSATLQFHSRRYQNSPLIGSALLTGSVHHLPSICNDACYGLRCDRGRFELPSLHRCEKA